MITLSLILLNKVYNERFENLNEEDKGSVMLFFTCIEMFIAILITIIIMG